MHMDDRDIYVGTVLILFYNIANLQGTLVVLCRAMYPVKESRIDNIYGQSSSSMHIPSPCRNHISRYASFKNFITLRSNKSLGKEKTTTQFWYIHDDDMAVIQWKLLCVLFFPYPGLLPNRK